MITQDFQSTKSPEETPGWVTDPPHCYILVSLLSDRAGLRAGSHDWVRACSSLDIGWSTRGMSVSRPSLTMAFILRPGSLCWPSLPSPPPVSPGLPRLTSQSHSSVQFSLQQQTQLDWTTQNWNNERLQTVASPTDLIVSEVSLLNTGDCWPVFTVFTVQLCKWRLIKTRPAGKNGTKNRGHQRHISTNLDMSAVGPVSCRFVYRRYYFSHYS